MEPVSRDVERFIGIEAIIRILCIETDWAESEIRGGVDDLSGPPAAAFGPTNRSGKTPTLDQTGRITYKRAVCTSLSDKLDVPPELIRTSKALNKSPSACSTAPLRGDPIAMR